MSLLLSGCIWNLERGEVGDIIDEYTDETFYELPADIPAGEPGEIIRVRPMLEAPAGSQAWRVIYHSRDMAGNDIPVSGLVIVPDSPIGVGDRTIVSWAHPTTGSAPACGPSLDANPFDLIEGLYELLAAGYAVAATDYQGMSIDGPSSYLLGVTEGNNVIDAVRAAKLIPGTGLRDDVLLWGHSQGGQAALFAAQQFKDYAPELTLQGVAVAAPAADLNALMTDDIVNLSGVTIASLAIPAMRAAYADRYSADEMNAILTPAGLEAIPSMEGLCLLKQNKELHAIADPLIGNFVTSDPATTEPWATVLKENSAGGSSIGVPIFIAQGLADELVIPTATEGYVERLCAAGEHVEFEKYDGITHALIADVAVPKVIAWYEQVQAGNPITATC
ncbi:lipase family protein [soil metagenome]